MRSNKLYFLPHRERNYVTRTEFSFSTLTLTLKIWSAAKRNRPGQATIFANLYLPLYTSIMQLYARWRITYDDDDVYNCTPYIPREYRRSRKIDKSSRIVKLTTRIRIWNIMRVWFRIKTLRFFKFSFHVRTSNTASISPVVTYVVRIGGKIISTCWNSCSIKKNYRVVFISKNGKYIFSKLVFQLFPYLHYVNGEARTMTTKLTAKKYSS